MAISNTHTSDRRHLDQNRADVSRRDTVNTTAARPAVKETRASRMSALDWIAMTLLIVGGLNWGLIGLLGINLVATLFGDMTLLSRVVYMLVGLSALYSIYTCSKFSKRR